MKNNIFLYSQNMEIHDKIRTVRQSKGYTQDFIADKIGIDTVNYGRIERGQAKLTIDRFIKIAEILETPPELFFANNNGNSNNEMLVILKKIYETELQILNKMKNENY